MEKLDDTTHVMRLCAELSALDDGTGDLGIIVREALRADPEVSAADIATIVREARRDHALDKAGPK